MNRFFRSVLLVVLTSLIATPAIALAHVAQTAQEAGLSANIKTIAVASAYLLGDTTNSGSHSFWNSEKKDARMFASVIEREYTDGTSLALLVVSPTKDLDVPEYAYASIYFSPMSIIEVREKTFSDWEFRGVLSKEAIVINFNNIYAYLIPAGRGTIIVRFEKGVGFKD